MSDSNDKGLTVVELFQKWMSDKKPLEIGTQFSIKGHNKIITLVKSENYPKGKFIDDDGNDFDIAMNPNFKFVQIVKDKDSDKLTYYNEDIWNAFDVEKNGTKVIKDEKKPIVLKGFGKDEINNYYQDKDFFDVTDFIKTLLNLKKIGIRPRKLNEFYFNIVMKVHNYPVLTKEKLYSIFLNCRFVKTHAPEIMRVEKNDEIIGYTLEDHGKFLFVPENKIVFKEYSYEDNQALGFYCTADSYLDIAVESIISNNQKFMIVQHNDPKKNIFDAGYQSSSTIKTLLAFSCECYLKSLLINNGVKMNELKDLGHSLVNLFSSLDGNLLANVFDFMQRHNYSIENYLYEPTYEASDITEKFMIDLAKNDSAFEDARYSAEFEKNTNYSFLFKFALALRACSNKEYRKFSPFTEFIETNVPNRSR